MSNKIPPFITHYVMKNSGEAVFVKEAEFFKEQGGHVEPWGKAWTGVSANTIEEARALGRRLPAHTNNRPGPPGESVSQPFIKMEPEDDEINYANHPVSMAELKSDKTNSGADWTIRDALINALRDIDSGVKSPTSGVIIFGTIDEKGNALTPYFYQATRNRYELLGLVEATKVKISS